MILVNWRREDREHNLNELEQYFQQQKEFAAEVDTYTVEEIRHFLNEKQ